MLDYILSRESAILLGLIFSFAYENVTLSYAIVQDIDFPLLFKTFVFKLIKFITFCIIVTGIIMLSIKFAWWYSLIYIAFGMIVVPIFAPIFPNPIVKYISSFFVGGYIIDLEYVKKECFVTTARYIALLGMLIMNIWLLILLF